MAIEDVIAGFLGNPFVFFLFAFVFSILIAVILPIPVELFLIIPFTAPGLDPGAKITLMFVAMFAVALGKAVGAWLVFRLGLKVGRVIRRWSARSKLFARFIGGLEKFVYKTGEIGLYVLLSIPLMSDTAVLYLFALFNKEGKAIENNIFVIGNFLAGINRVALVFILGLTIYPALLKP